MWYNFSIEIYYNRYNKMRKEGTNMEFSETHDVELKGVLNEKVEKEIVAFLNTNNGTIDKEPVSIVVENSYNYNVKDIPVLVKYDTDWVELGIIKDKIPSKICVSTDYEWCDERQDIEDKYPNFVKYVKDKNTIWY